MYILPKDGPFGPIHVVKKLPNVNKNISVVPDGMFVYLNRYGKNRFKITYFFTVQHSSVYYYYWPAAFSVNIDTLTLCCAHSMTTYVGSQKLSAL
jgi:hypothetical protein